jgi:hypothetical protein
MGGYGSGRRSTRKSTVEECRTCDISLFTKSLVLQAGGFLWWTNRAGETTCSMRYVSKRLGNDSGVVRFSYEIGADDRRREIEEPVEVVATLPHFGGIRWWFICPLSVDGCKCHRRVRKLYLPRGGTYFGCRSCYKLTYESIRSHDERVGRLVRNPEALLAALESKSLAISVLGLRAYCKLRGFL